jgi:hypothetical protein
MSAHAAIPMKLADSSNLRSRLLQDLQFHEGLQFPEALNRSPKTQTPDPQPETKSEIPNPKP